MDDDKVMKIVQYKMPPIWMEYSTYAGAVLLLAAAHTTGVIWYTMGLAGMLMYWNYRLFVTIREYVRYVNTSEFSKLLTMIAEEELNKHKDGTFQDSECLTKEQGDVEGQDPEGD